MANEQLDHLQKLATSLQGIGGRSAKILHNAIKLSDYQYTSKMRFLMEILQNCDDNFYESDHPTVLFELLDNDPTNVNNPGGALRVENNEIGFSVADVESMMSVGESTKQGREGVIGHKGIGLKSLFSVADRVYFSSNGYQFYLSSNSEPVGFLIPTWDENNFAKPKDPTNNTGILLSLKPEFRNDIQEVLNTFQAEALLFLNKIRVLRITIRDETTVFKCENQNSPGFRRLFCDEQYFDCYIERIKLNIQSKYTNPEISHLKTTHLTLAFPLPPISTKLPNVFVYLPTLHNSGLNFFVNADFVLTMTREYIQMGEAWNQWLMKCVGEHCIDAIARVVTNHYPEGYCFVPDFSTEPVFKELRTQILTGLKNKNIVKTIEDHWVLPANAYRCPKDHWFELFIGGQVAAGRNSKNAVPLVDSRLDNFSPTLRALGVKNLSSEQFVQWISDLEWLAKLVENKEQLKKLYEIIQHFEVHDEQIRELPLLLTSSGRFVSGGKNKPTYYLLAEDARSTLSWIPQDLQQKLNFCDAVFYSTLPSSVQSWLMRVYSIKQLNISNVLKEVANL